ncbi:transpeptidase family protein [Olivibacter sp. SDN3]|uniref:penicillin-binding protein n=1 Tax=Olivibacter sp. SDN3 TaxID=2764720 RepID=UPI001651AE50|nr:penicillin-binding protein [Olivibacter sp. SDN3]QNL50123.1 transpeptidase family protein [Olivibacter sp. SDN3]
MNIRTDILLRVYLSFGVMVIFAVAVLYKMFGLQMVEGQHWQAMADSLSTRYQTVEATRGNIFSSDGSLLATSVPEYDVRMDMVAPGILEDDVFYAKVDSLASNLAVFFKDKSVDQYRRLLRKARKDRNRYYLVKRNVSFQEMKVVRTFPIFNLGKYKGGLIAEQKNKRILPFKTLAARTIGYKNENVQPVGLEGAYANYIDGLKGSRLVQRIAGGSWMPINEDTEVAPTDGADIISTIDINMQDVAQRALEKQLIASDADNGCVILMEVATGEVRAVANFTRVDEGHYKEKFNYAIAQSSEPGSTFKLASYMAALEDGKIDTSDIVDTEDGTFRVHRHTIRDSHHGGYGKISVKRAFEVSSNTAITKLIHQNYKDNPGAFTKRLYAMHLNDPLGLQIPGEGTPLIKTPKSKSWSGLSLPQMAYGYELKVTPLQMLTLYNAVANDGKMVAPLFVKEIRRLGNTVEKFEARVINEKIVSEETLGKIKGMLEGVVEEGTARELKNSLFKMAGKTGTAQMADGAAGYKSKRRYQGSFAGYFPADNPKYSMIVVIQNPRKGGYYAIKVAAPVFKEVAERVYAADAQMYHDFNHLKYTSVNNIPTIKAGFQKDSQHVFNAFGLNTRHKEAEEDTTEELRFLVDDDIDEGRVPDLRGMGLKDAMYLLGNVGMKPFVKGKGKVVKQSVTPGETINKGLPITIELE